MNTLRYCLSLPGVLLAAMIALPAGAATGISDEPLPGLRLPASLVQPPEPSAPLNTRFLAEDAAQSGKGKTREPFPWRATPPGTPDYRGAARDTGYFMLYQTVIIGVIYVLPESISGWSKEDKENYSKDTWKENVRNPHWDDDDFVINYVLHPYWGATYYVRGRERGFSPTQSFFFSAGLSFLYEFGFEALFEQPSYQDLIVTPVAGSLLGEYWFWGLRNRIKAKPGSLTWQDKTILVLTDPLGTAGTLTDRLLGIGGTKVAFQVDNLAATMRSTSRESTIGAAPLYERRVHRAPAWGLRLSVAW